MLLNLGLTDHTGHVPALKSWFNLGVDFICSLINRLYEKIDAKVLGKDK